MGRRSGAIVAAGIGLVAIVSVGACSSFDEPPGAGGGADGGRGDGAGGDAASGPNGCPSGRGPTMVRVEDKLCIDSTEVTHAQYSDFLAAMSTGSDAPIAECTANTSLYPNDDALWKLAPGKGLFPITQVDWCDAHSFCAWSGKRLCGRIGTGDPVALDQAVIEDPKIDEWFYACSEGGKRAFPYGASFVQENCNVELPDGGDGRIHEVKSFPGCVGGFPGIFDMSGNVMEWMNACDSNDPSAKCFVRSSGFFENESVAACGAARSQPRTGFLFHIGIRCCASPN